jgi:signal transduction histidine kinase
MARREIVEEVVRIYAHDLRGPLAALDTALACLTPASRGDDFAFFRDSCVDASTRLRQMVDNLETVALLAEQDRWITEPTDLRPDLDALVLGLARSFQLRELKLSLSLSRSMPVNANPALARIAVRNLVLDALEHSPAGAVVTIESAATTVRVSDEGPVVSPDNLPLAGHADGQAELKRRGARISRGFGWPAARLAMERQGGRLELEAAGSRGMRAMAHWQKGVTP